MEYTSSIWDLRSKTPIQSLERAQNDAAHFIFSIYSLTVSITSTKNFLQLSSCSVLQIVLPEFLPAQ